MKTLTRWCVRAAILAVVFVGGGVYPAAAQGDVCATAGAGVYDSDAFCLNSGATFTVIELCASADLVGASVAYSNGSHPWIPPDAPASALDGPARDVNLFAGRLGETASRESRQQQAFLTNGNAVRIMAETFPVALLSRLAEQREGFLSDINRYVRPFLGAGLYISGDGDAAPAGTAGRELPTFGLEGSTNLMLSYGVRAYLPGRDKLVRLVLLYRGNTMFPSDVVYRTPDNGTLRRDGETLTWGEWGIGVSLRIGG